MDILTEIENRLSPKPSFKKVTLRAVNFDGRIRLWSRAKARRAIRLARSWGMDAYDAGPLRVTVSNLTSSTNLY